MSKVRVYQLAKELGVSSKELITKLKDLSVEVGNHMSSLSNDDANLLIELFTEDKKEVSSNDNQEPKVKLSDKPNEPVKVEKSAQVKNVPTEESSKKNKKSKKKQKNKKKGPTMKDEKELIEVKTDERSLEIGESIILKDLTDLLDKTPTEVISKLISLGMMVTINQEIDFETAAMVASEYGVELTQAGIVEDSDVVDDLIIPEDDEKDLMPRPPVVTVMGHVDHGKTSLLDAIRKTKVTAKEAGGITQHIGASEILVNDKKIVFLDTPGHEAFTSMRARGAKVTDIAILVVAADDGVMPQTIEAINHAKAAEVPIIVAINKIDKPGANPDRVKQELSDHGILIEEWGGDVISVPVSAIEGTNINDLLEMILLVSEMEEFKANPNREALGVVIEAKLDKGKGTVATVLIQNGTLHVGDSVVVGSTYGRVRAMTNHLAEKLTEATPSTAVEITGLSDVPEAGNLLVAVADDKIARNIAEKRAHKLKVAQQKINQRVSLDDLYNQMQQGEIKELNIIVKADVQGSVQAVKQSLEKLSNDKVVLKTIHGGVGAITESDVMLAAASNAIITGFNVRPTSSATAISKKEKVDIRTYRIIYNAIEDIEAAMIGMLDPEFKEVDLGKAQVRAVFKVPGAGVVAGSYVTEGKILRNASIRLVRDGIVVHDGSIGSLRRFKDDVKEVNTGYECGIGIDKFNDVKEGDIIEAYTMEEIKR